MNTKQALSESTAELKRLCYERDVLDRKIKGLVQVIEGLKLMDNESVLLAPLSKIPSIDEIGITEGVRNYFEYVAAGPVFPVEIRDALMAAGYAGNEQAALLAVHSVLSRMEKKGEVDEVKRDGKTAYVWVSVLQRAVRHMQNKKTNVAAMDSVLAALGFAGSSGMPVVPGRPITEKEKK